MTRSPHGMGVVWRLGAATTFIVTAFAMVAPVLAVLLQQRGHGTAAIGAFSMIPFLMVGLLMPVMPRALGRWGVVRTYRAGAFAQLIGAIGYAAGDGLAVWAAGSVLTGMGAAALWNATEALLAREAPPDKRGRVMGLYQTSLGAALALGPFAPALLRLDAQGVLWGAVLLVLVCCLIVWRIPHHASREPAAEGPSGLWHALAAVPLLALVAFCGGVFEAGLSAVSAANGSAIGLDLRSAASIAGAIGMGSFLCQLPAGWAADHFRIGQVFAAASLLLLAASAALAFAGQAPWLLWATGLVWGGVGGALYTLTMVQVAHVFAGRQTAGGTAAMITGYTLGGVVGPLASGAALQWAGLGGLSAALSALALATLWAGRAAAARA